ncbi:MAG TPA: hypothetical protein VFH44_03225 [Solirubrobacterales bacterium]|nr:hypothetical protein [Solirubrobacterales bacterium]
MNRPTAISKLTWISAPLLVFAGLFAVLAISGPSRDPLLADSSAAAGPPASGDTAALIVSLRQAVRAEPGDAAALTALGSTWSGSRVGPSMAMTANRPANTSSGAKIQVSFEIEVGRVIVGPLWAGEGSALPERSPLPAPRAQPPGGTGG